MSVSKVIRPNGATVWKATIRDAAGRQIAKTFPHTDAGYQAGEAWQATKLAERAGGTPAPVQRGIRLFHGFALDTVAAHRVRESTRQRYASSVRVHLSPSLGKTRLDRITTEQCQKLFDELEEQLASTTVHQTAAVLRLVMKTAVEQYKLTKNPVTGLKLTRSRRRDLVRHLESDELAALCAAADPMWAAAYRLGAGLGLRQGELLAFGTERRHLNLRLSTYYVARQVTTQSSARMWITDQLKTERSYRPVPLSEELLADARFLISNAGPGQPLLHRADGRLHSKYTANTIWRRNIRNAGLDPALTMHSLRHTYASLLLDDGLSLLLVSQMLGHATVAETTETYGHLLRKAHTDVNAAVSKFLTAA